MFVVGTAGHVDHGKSTLVAALTGIHPDRLKEEQTREMTIELGFAWLTLPDGNEVGIVDVPGHRDFIENMLAGAGGMDAAILVIAADEGVMPQTREHLAILDLLHIQTGIIAITKSDLAESPEWLDLVEAEIHGVTAGTRMQDAPIVRVSARTGSGLPELVATLQKSLTVIHPRVDYHRPRLPVDRVFTIQGFGTVVTGTLLDGTYHIGDEVEVLPGGKRGRIRGLQTHKTKEEYAGPGQRTAVNLTGIDLDEIQRGDVLSFPGKYTPSRRIEAEVELLRDSSAPLQHHNEVKFYLGAKETVGFARLLGQENIPPGGKGFVQFELRDAITAFQGDRFILRRPSPGETIGGGVVLDTRSTKRLKRFSPDVIRALQVKLEGDPRDRHIQYLRFHSPISSNDFENKAGFPVDHTLLDQLVEVGEVIRLSSGKIKDDAFLVEKTALESLTSRVEDLLRDYHARNKLRPGMPREELKRKLDIPSRVFGELVSLWMNEGVLMADENLVKAPGFTIEYTRDQQQHVDQALREIRANRFSPPSVKDLIDRLGEPVYLAMVQNKSIYQVSAEVIFDAQTLQEMTEKIRIHIEQNGTISLAECRDMFQTSRKFAQALLEFLDQTGVTMRVGDIRKLR